MLVSADNFEPGDSGVDAWTGSDFYSTRLSVNLYDIHKQSPSPPRQYTCIYGYPVLIWNGDRSQPMEDSLQKQAIHQCLDQIVGNRLIHFVPGRTEVATRDHFPWGDLTNKDGSPKIVVYTYPEPRGVRRQIIVFLKNGGIEHRGEFEM